MNPSAQSNPATKEPSLWVDLAEAAAITGVSEITIKRHGAARRIHPSCGRLMCNRWRFRKDVIIEKGIVLIGDSDAPAVN